MQRFFVSVRYALLPLTLLLSSLNPVIAGEADVIKVDGYKDGDRGWRFNVTVRHDDTGWDHYANRWEIITEDGTILATRVLHHPHENEQPFTRSLSGVEIPKGVKKVFIRAHDSVHGYGGQVEPFVVE
ncbi:hypothetical protein [Kiloniella sp. EL199]|uniref:hypothetical protein n=1 Tax=Kiloniella sp. EL199 TaxID=2107581 RepID=UPI000EA36569|nr:hypothetical protein [Kiloniella sp. EL199]